MSEVPLPVNAIIRDPENFSRNEYDLIVIGAGIYGVMLSLEAARRGLSCLLLERDDFGQHTSFNHLRILHGGLRYLQHLDLKRFRDSVCERSWFLRHFPKLTKPLTCLMPLSGRGFYRPSVFKAALALDSLLAFDQNRRIPPASRIGRGRVCSPTETRKYFSALRDDAVGAALWQDGFISDSPRLMIELLRWACAYGIHALNYCPAENLKVEDGRVIGVDSLDSVSGRRWSFRSSRVINASGPWNRAVAGKWDRDIIELFPQRILVWNLQIARPSVSEAAVAVSAPGGKHTYFIVPWQGRMLIGTGHKLLDPGKHRPPVELELSDMLNDLNAAVPGLNLNMGDLQKVFWGVMPGNEHCELGKRPFIHDHGIGGGPTGLLSVSGVKFTTARKVADGSLRYLFPDRAAKPYGPDFQPGFGDDCWTELEGDPLQAWQKFFREEAITSLSDALMRRSDKLSARNWSTEELAELAKLLPGDASCQQLAVKKILDEMNGMFTSISGEKADVLQN